MTHEREHEHLSSAHDAPKRDDATPGRISTSAAMNGPVSPEPSGILARAATSVARAEDRDDNNVSADAEQHVARASTSSGSALPDDLRDSFEASLGADLSGVRVHDDTSSATAAHAVGAKAYTMGQDIHFGAGQYNPSTPEGQLLLAHEVAHTVQQAGGTPTRQNKLTVSAPADASELEADRAAEAMVARKPFAIGSAGAGGASRAIHRKTSVGGSVSAKDGIKFTFSAPLAKGSISYVTLSNPTVAVTAKPTADAEVKTRPTDQTEVTGGVTPGSGGDASVTSDHKGKTSGNEHSNGAKVQAAIKKKWGDVAFTDAMGEVGTSGGSISLVAGGEWKNAVLDVKFALLSFGKDGKDIKFLTATASAMARGTIEVDGVNFAVSLKLSVDVKPNSKAIAKFLIKKGIVKSLRGFGKAFEAASALPFLFIEGGYETLKAAYKNVVAGKDMARFVDMANKVSLEVGDAFVAGVLGGNKGLGSKSGKQWFQQAYELARADNPEMTDAEFRQALVESASWQESAKIAVARQVRAVLYNGFVADKKDDVHSKDMEHVKQMLFGDDGPPDLENGIGVPVPQIEKRTDPGHRDIAEEHSSKGVKVPAAVREEVKHRVAGGQLSGSVPYNGTTYEFTYDRGAILVHGGEQSEVIPFQR